MEAELDRFPFKHHWKSYLELGLTPLPANGKNPVVRWKRYQNEPPCSDEYLEWEDEHATKNVWVLLGNERAVIDPEDLEAENFVQTLNLPEGPISISGRDLKHPWFKTSSRIKAMKIRKNCDEAWLELRTGPIGMIVPPSIHPDTKKPYRWMEGHSPWEIPLPELPMEAYEKIESLFVKREPKPKPRMMPAGDNNFGSLDVERYLNHYGIKYRVKRESSRTFYLLECCLFADLHTTKDIPGDSSVVQGLDGKLGYFCFHNH